MKLKNCQCHLYLFILSGASHLYNKFKVQACSRLYISLPMLDHFGIMYLVNHLKGENTKLYPFLHLLILGKVQRHLPPHLWKITVGIGCLKHSNSCIEDCNSWLARFCPSQW